MSVLNMAPLSIRLTLAVAHVSLVSMPASEAATVGFGCLSQQPPLNPHFKLAATKLLPGIV